MSSFRSTASVLLPLTLAFLALPGRAQVQTWIDQHLGAFPSAGAAIVSDASGNSYVGGSANLAGSSRWLVLKYSPTGALLWQQFLGGASGSYDGVTAIAVDGVGGVYATGAVGNNCVTGKYDAATGGLLWSSTSAGASGRALVLSNDGTLYVAAATLPQTTSDIRTIKYDACGGTQMAWAQFNGIGNGADTPFAMAVDSEGAAIVVGSTYKTGGFDYDYVTLKYAPACVQAWVSTYDANVFGNPYPIDQAFAVAVDQRGDVYVTGQSYGGSAFGHDYATVKYLGTNGIQAWVSRYDGGVGANDVAWGVAVDDRCGRVYVTGEVSDPSGGGDFVTIRYSAATGAQSWLKKFQDPGNNTPRAIVVDHAGDVYVAGSSNWDYLLVKYRGANGLQTWWAKYNGTANNQDGAEAMALDRSGCLTLTGKARDTTFMDRCTTLRFCTACTSGRTAL